MGGQEQAVDGTSCMECGRELVADEPRQTTAEGAFCLACFERLAAQVKGIFATQAQDINYPLATVGGMLGGFVGGLVWWGFTVLTNVAFGLVAIVIGVAVGKGVHIFSGRKRSRALQVLSVALAAVSYFGATYMVTRSFLLDHPTDTGAIVALPLLPDPLLALSVVRLGFDGFDLLFLAIAMWEAWKIPAPIRV